MINLIWKYRVLIHRLPVLMALLAGLMFTAMPGGKSVFSDSSVVKEELAQQKQTSPLGEDLPVFKPCFSALAQVAPLQLFFYQPVVLKMLYPLVEIVEPAPANVPPLVNQFHKTLFRQIISPNAP